MPLDGNETLYSHITYKYIMIKASLGMLVRLLWGRGGMIGSLNGKHKRVYVEYVQGFTNEQ